MKIISVCSILGGWLKVGASSTASHNLAQQEPLNDMVHEIGNQISDIHRSINDTIHDEERDVRNRTIDAFHRTIGDIGNRTHKAVNETSKSFSSYVTHVVKDVIGFIKSIFGETDTPGQPALPPSSVSAGMSPVSIQGSARYTEKAVYLSLLSVLVYIVLSRPICNKTMTVSYETSYYRNLDENFLYNPWLVLLL
jgi:hypothetical protein